ncbi:MAG: hypothetical protein ACFB03_19510 [Paracoccaceae bacterium]
MSDRTASIKRDLIPAPFAVCTHMPPVANATSEAWGQLTAALADIRRWNDECERIELANPGFAIPQQDLGKPYVNALKAAEHALNVAYDDFSTACTRVLASPIKTPTDAARIIGAARFDLSAPEDIDALIHEIRTVCARTQEDYHA